MEVCFKKTKGFTLVEIIISVTILAIVAAIVLVAIEPGELIRRGRDSSRVSDLENLQKAIGVIIQDTPVLNKEVLCGGLDYPCGGRSTDTDINVRDILGQGWVKVNLSNQKAIIMPLLPIDPLNTPDYHYLYCANNLGKKDGFEIDTVLESQQYSYKLKTDGGDDDNKYEVGTNLSLVGSTPCNY